MQILLQRIPNRNTQMYSMHQGYRNLRIKGRIFKIENRGLQTQQSKERRPKKKMGAMAENSGYAMEKIRDLLF